MILPFRMITSYEGLAAAVAVGLRGESYAALAISPNASPATFWMSSSPPMAPPPCSRTLQMPGCCPVVVCR